MASSTKRQRPILQPRPYDDVSFRERLSEEYKMLQAKVDTIGSFRITIKGWSVVALAGAAAASSKVGPGTTLLLSGGLAILIVIFFRLEFEQVRLSSLYIARAGRIERALISVQMGRGEIRAKRMPVPYTATEIVMARKEGLYADGDTPYSVALRSHAVLYGVLVFLSLLVGGRLWLEYLGGFISCLHDVGCHPVALWRCFLGVRG